MRRIPSSYMPIYFWDGLLVLSAQIRSSGLLLGLPLLFLICMSFKSGISFLITFMLLRFLVPNLLLLVKISALLLHVFCFPSSSYDHQSKPISCPLSWMLQCYYYLQIGRLCLLSIQKYSHVILGNS
jgi:hypothetical protein